MKLAQIATISLAMSGLAGCGGAAVKLSDERSYDFARSANCLERRSGIEAYRHPASGAPIKGVSIYDGERESAVLYFAPSRRSAQDLALELSSDEPRTFGNVVLIWVSKNDDLVHAINQCVQSDVD